MNDRVPAESRQPCELRSLRCVPKLTEGILTVQPKFSLTSFNLSLRLRYGSVAYFGHTRAHSLVVGMVAACAYRTLFHVAHVPLPISFQPAIGAHGSLSTTDSCRAYRNSMLRHHVEVSGQCVAQLPSQVVMGQSSLLFCIPWRQAVLQLPALKAHPWPLHAVPQTSKKRMQPWRSHVDWCWAPDSWPLPFPLLVLYVRILGQRGHRTCARASDPSSDFSAEPRPNAVH
jgi:hypothetical protein